MYRVNIVHTDGSETLRDTVVAIGGGATVIEIADYNGDTVIYPYADIVRIEKHPYTEEEIEQHENEGFRDWYAEKKAEAEAAEARANGSKPTLV